MKFLSAVVGSFLILHVLAVPEKENVEGEINTKGHPFDPLSGIEIENSANVINNQQPATKQGESKYIFNWITLKEPTKASMINFIGKPDSEQDFSTVPRRSLSVLIEKSTGDVYEAIVNLNNKTLESMTRIPKGNQPSLSPEDMEESEQIFLADPEAKKRCEALGYNITNVMADPWSMGYIQDRPEYIGKRLIQMYPYGIEFKEDNQYAHPFPFIAIVDVVEKKVIAFEDLPTHDSDGVVNKNAGVTVPRKSNNYDYKLREKGFLRTNTKEVRVDNPDGVSYKVTGNVIEWQKFKIRTGFNGREGLVLYDVSYKDGNETRPLLYRAALSEFFIPYGDPRPPYHRKAVFDMGEYGIGFQANPLRTKADCTGTVYFFNGVLNFHNGTARKFPNVICVNEDEDGMLWKHTEYRSGKVNVARANRLTISFVATVGNYDYAFYWHFFQDATMQFTVRATGEISTNLLALGNSPYGHGTEVMDQVNGQYHQHLFAIRIDPILDGQNNSVAQVDIVADSAPTGDPKNKYGQGFGIKSTVFKTPGEAKSKMDATKGRSWVIINPNRKNPYTKQPVGWKLMPMNSLPLLMHPDSPLVPKAGFTTNDLWVTPYREDQLYAGGFYLNETGLPEWSKADESANIDNADIVLWHVFGLTHIVRVEDFPVMPFETAGFVLKPKNFFNENPALDVPPPKTPKEKSEL